MFGSEILEIAVGLVFIYLLLSLVVTAVTEAFSRLMAMRSRNLYAGIKNLLGEVRGSTTNTDQFFNSSIIKSLTQPGYIWGRLRRRPGYISAKRFYQGLLQSLGTESLSAEEIEEFIKEKTSGELRKNLETFWASAENDIEKFQSQVEEWYDDSMDRVSGWFKRKAHTYTVIIAFVITVTFNASTLNVVEVLWTDDARRAAVTKLAEDVVSSEEASSTGSQEKPTKDAIEQGKQAVAIITDSSALPLGWKAQNPFNRTKLNEATGEPISGWSVEKWISHFLGWLLTTFALTLGAPFWFDTLKRVVNLRTSGTPPRSGNDETGASPSPKTSTP